MWTPDHDTHMCLLDILWPYKHVAVKMEQTLLIWDYSYILKDDFWDFCSFSHKNIND